MPNQLLRSRQIAFDRQGGKCYYCGISMWLDGPGHSPRLQCTAEHLKARSDGGSDRPENIVAACAHCNQTRHKRKRPPEPMAYREEVKLRVRRWLASGMSLPLRAAYGQLIERAPASGAAL